MTDDRVPSGYGDRWADVYDEVHAELTVPDEQLDLLTSLAGHGRALELGIGTGRVALPLAARGVRIEGLDASRKMVDRLRAKPGGADLPVTIGDMADVPVEGQFTLVYVVFNSLFNLLEQARQVRCFRQVAAVLSPGGTFLLECFVPDLGRFDRGQSLRTFQVRDDEVRLDASLHDAVGQTVRSHHITIRDGSVTTWPIHLRYAWPSELDLMAELAGLRLRSRTGSWSADPFTESSGNHISVYERPG